jgi:hypothetical protein
MIDHKSIAADVSTADQIVDHALSLILDDLTIGGYVTDAVDKRLGRKGPQDAEFWATYTIVVDDLLQAVRKKNQPAAKTP